MRRKAFLILTLLLISLLWPDRVALAGTQTQEMGVEYSFGEQATFHARVKSSTAIEKATIFIQAKGDNHTIVGDAAISPHGEIIYDLDYTHYFQDYPLRAFSKVAYYFLFTDENGDTYKTPTDEFIYEDNRFNWQLLEDAPFRVHWYQGELAFAQKVLDVAQEGLLRIQGLFSSTEAEIIDIYIYPNGRDMMDTFRLSGVNWIAGHADPDLGVMIVALPEGPEQQLQIEQRIPHELMHILLFQSTGTGYQHLPTWLKEGLASTVEQYPNPDYRILLDNAIENENLLSFNSLCETFPQEASSALLAYAQSASFVNFLHRTYGTSGLKNLVNGYADGLDCERGTQMAYGKKLGQLGNQWQRDEFPQNEMLEAWNNISPWLFIMLATMLFPIIFSLSKLRSKHSNQPVE